MCDMYWCFLQYTCSCTYSTVMDRSSYYVLCSCYECLLSCVGSVHCYLVFNSHNVSNIRLYMSLYASFMCSLFILILYIQYCFNVLGIFLLRFYDVHCIGYTPIFVLCSIDGSNELNYRYCFEFPVLYIWCKMFSSFALFILVGNP
jgi:hypothetical protein